MTKVLVLYYSSYGHLETMAEAIADGARSTGADVTIKRVAETAPLEVAQAAHFKLDQKAEIATVGELKNYDAIIVGTGTRFGRMSWPNRHRSVIPHPKAPRAAAGVCYQPPGVCRVHPGNCAAPDTVPAPS